MGSCVPATLASLVDFAHYEPGRCKGKGSGKTHCCLTQFMTGAMRMESRVLPMRVDSFSLVVSRCCRAGEGSCLAATVPPPTYRSVPASVEVEASSTLELR